MGILCGFRAVISKREGGWRISLFDGDDTEPTKWTDIFYDPGRSRVIQLAYEKYPFADLWITSLDEDEPIRRVSLFTDFS